MPAVSKKQRIEVDYEDRAYIAGFLDGEGNITILGRNQTKAKNPCYGLHVGFTNRDLPVLLWIRSLYGGNLFEKHRRSLKHSRSYELRIGKKESVGMLLNDIYPFVRIKSKQVELALAFLSLPRVRMELIKYRGKTWPLFNGNKEDVKKREIFKSSLNILNQRGDVYAS